MIEDDENEPSSPLWYLKHDAPVQLAHTRSDDGVGSIMTTEPTEQFCTNVQTPLPIVLLKVNKAQCAQIRSLVNVGGVISVNPTPHMETARQDVELPTEL